MQEINRSRKRRHNSDEQFDTAPKKAKNNAQQRDKESKAIAAPTAALCDLSVVYEQSTVKKLPQPSLFVELCRYRAVQKLHAEFDRQVTARFRLGFNKFK